jgi:hypothetical protein
VISIGIERLFTLDHIDEMVIVDAARLVTDVLTKLDSE